MKSVRERFEEIWPVPEGVYFGARGFYMPEDKDNERAFELSDEWDARLDTFTRCQETTFSKEELNLFRQWFNSMEDVNPKYVEPRDRELYARLMEILK